jgi:integrase
MKTMVPPEGLREGRQLPQAACARLSALRSPKQAVKTYCRRTYEFNTHSLRYAFITHLLRLSHSPSIVAKIMGHSSLDHILHYTEVKVAEEVLAGLRRIRSARALDHFSRKLLGKRGQVLFPKGSGEKR